MAKDSLPERDCSPKRETHSRPNFEIEMAERKQSNTRYSNLEAVLLTLAYHGNGEAYTPTQLSKMCQEALGYKITEKQLRQTLMNYQYDADIDPDYPFISTARKWKLNSDARIGFEDPQWEEFVFAPVRTSSENDITSHENSVNSEESEEQESVSKGLLELGNRPEDLRYRVQYLEMELQRLQKIEQKYFAVKRKIHRMRVLLA